MLERRYADRFEIPGAQVAYRMGGKVEAQMPLTDITNGGVRFAIQHDFTKGDLIELDIHIPQKCQIYVKGNIVWSSDIDAAVQFLPFGTDTRYNSFESYQLIKDIMSDCVNCVYQA